MLLGILSFCLKHVIFRTHKLEHQVLIVCRRQEESLLLALHFILRQLIRFLQQVTWDSVLLGVTVKKKKKKKETLGLGCGKYYKKKSMEGKL